MTEEGVNYKAKAVICATGSFNYPYIPNTEGEHLFEGRTLHSFHYRRPERFAGERVVAQEVNNKAICYRREIVSTTFLPVRSAFKLWNKNKKLLHIPLKLCAKSIFHNKAWLFKKSKSKNSAQFSDYPIFFMHPNISKKTYFSNNFQKMLSYQLTSLYND